MTIENTTPLKPCPICSITPEFEPAWDWFDLEKVSLRVICHRCRTSTYWSSWRTDQSPKQVTIDKQKAVAEVVHRWNNMKIDYED